MQLIEPTPDERRNGWTAETLTRYIRERNGGEDFTAHRLPDRRGEVRVESADSRHPHDW